MFNTTHYLFDSFDINKPSHFKLTIMRNSIKYIGAIVLLLSFAFGTSSVIAQKSFKNKAYLDKTTKSANDHYTYVYLKALNSDEISSSHSLFLIPQIFGFDINHEFSSRWPQLIEKHQDELENLFEYCQVDCAKRFKALLKSYDFSGPTIVNAISRYETYQLRKAKCMDAWFVLSLLKEKLDKNALSAIRKNWTDSDSHFALSVLSMSEDSFLRAAIENPYRFIRIVKQLDRYSQVNTKY